MDWGRIKALIPGPDPQRVPVKHLHRLFACCAAITSWAEVDPPPRGGLRGGRDGQRARLQRRCIIWGAHPWKECPSNGDALSAAGSL